ncbi:MAG TPA: glycine betaine ABC transporter substrate-binding protein [Actinomycetota bacterium]|nr:glycine betaine ABC transporter substrate-binding protein [Actinomycetota bacterium]
MRNRRWGMAAIALVSVLVLAACSDVEDDPGDGAAGGDTGAAAETGTDGAGAVAQCGGDPIRIAVNPWTGSTANATVAKVILEQEMGCSVELVEIDEFAQFPGLAQGDLDATLEVWPSGHAEDYATYIEGDGGVVDGGELGVVGNIGWFLPTYLVEENPDLATVEGLQGNEEMFATAETGDRGQFLAGDPSFVSYDEQIIESLGLDFEVVYSGSEAALLSALDAAYAAEDPLLMYFWSPHWAQAKYDLTEVELPAYNEECEDAALNRDGEGYACDYADDVLYKAFAADLEERDPAAFAFLSAMKYTNDDQNSIALAIDDGGMSPEEAAQQWVDANEDVWSAWLPTE